MRVLVVDDEPPARARLVRLLADLGITDVLEASDAAQAARVLSDPNGVRDVVLLDVTMPGVDGISFAAHTRLPVVVFVTGDASHAARAFDVEAADFLVKPVTRERLGRAIERAKRRAALTPSEEGVRLRVVESERERWIDATRVDHFRADAKYVVFDDGAGEQLVRESLDTLEPQLPLHARVHRGHLVRLGAITELRSTDEGAIAVLRSGAEVPVSRRAVASVRARLRA